MHNSLKLNSHISPLSTSTSIQHKEKIYERLEKEQDTADFIKTLLKLKQKKINNLTINSNDTPNSLTPHNVNNLSVSHRKAIYVNCPLTKTFSHDKLKAPKSFTNSAHKRGSSHKVTPILNNNIINTNNNNHILLSKQNIVSRNTNTLNTMDYYRNSLSNVSQGKVKVLNQFKQSKVNKPKINKDTSKQMSLLNVKNCSKYVGNTKDNKFVLKPKQPESSFKQNSQMTTITTTSNKHSLNNNNSSEVRYANTAENTKIVNRKGINVPVTVINLFSGDDGANNNADKCDMGNVHARNLSERIGIENDFKNVDMNNNNNNNIPHEKKIKVFFFKKSTNKKK
jgi:hypothetical protein